MLIVVFSVNLGWFPAGGMETMASGKRGVVRMLDILQHMVMPVTTLGLFYVALYTRVMRASMLEVFNQDFVTTARAKGLSESRITLRHVFRNALLPMVTLIGGLGRLAFEAVFQRDINLLLGILLMCSVLVVLSNILVDVMYSQLDPRIRIR